MSDNKKNHHINLTQGSVHKHLIRMALPMIIGIAASMGFLLADTFFIGKLGPNELAAVGFAGPIIMIIVATSIGLGAGTSSVMARAAGRGDQEELIKLATNSFIISALLSLGFTVIGLLTIDPLFRIMGADETILPLIRDYMEIWYWAPIFVITPMVAMGIMRSVGDTSLQGKILILASLANVILDPILIFGLLGFPRMELAGAALATLIARAGSFVAVVYYLTYRFHVLKFNRAIVADFWISTKKIMHVGIPAAGTNIIIPIANGVIIAIIATFGNDAVAGTTVALRIETFSIIFFFALSSIIGPFVGQNLGARKHDRIQLALKQSAIFCLLWGAALAVLIALFAPGITGVFSDKSAISGLATSYLFIVPLSYGAYGIVMTANAAFNGLGQPLPGVMISTLRVVIFQIPMVLLAAWYMDLAYVFAAASLSNILAGILAYFWITRTARNLA